jgi:hypothetical protein
MKEAPMFPRQDGQGEVPEWTQLATPVEAAADRETAAPAAKPERPARRRRVGKPGRPADRGARVFGVVLSALMIVLVLIAIIGERYGMRAPTPGHLGKTIACQGRFQVVCF